MGALVLAPVVGFYWDTQALLTYWYWFVLIGFLGTVGHLMLLWAFMRASASVLTPYLYSQIAFATLGGWLVFDHVPDAFAWAGIAVIAAAGVGNAMLLAQEMARHRHAAARTVAVAPPTPS
jgi:drug/metabolite transporter (DMT)-like permease